jgi:hypothetical protein
MGRTSSTFNSDVPWALLTCIAGIVVVESAIRVLPDTLWTRLLPVSEVLDDEAFRFRSRIESMSPVRPALLLMGSSQIREGADTAQIEQILYDAGLGEMQAINLGTSAGAFLELYGQLDLALRKKPAIIVASPGPHGLYWPYADLDPLAEYCYSLESAGSLIWNMRSSVGMNALQRFLGIACMYELLPSSRLIRSYDIHSLGVRWMRNYQPVSPEYYYSKDLSLTEMEEAFHKFPRPRFSKQTTTQAGLAREAIEKVMTAGATICFLDFPLNPAAEAITSAWNPSIRGSEEVLDGLAEIYRFRYIKRDSLPQFDAGDFRDVCHLNQRGRSRMSRLIAELTIQELRSQEGRFVQAIGETKTGSRIPGP